MKEGLLLFRTHSWSDKNLRDGIYDPKTEPACVGILPNLFMKRVGAVREINFYGHYSTHGDVSKNYDKLLIPMIHRGIAKEVKIGDASSYVVEVKPMADWVIGLLKKNPSLFDDDQPIE